MRDFRMKPTHNRVCVIMRAPVGRGGRGLYTNGIAEQVLFAVQRARFPFRTYRKDDDDYRTDYQRRCNFHALCSQA